MPLLADVALEEEEEHRGGSTLRHVVIQRDREEGRSRLWKDYFALEPTYPEHMFHRKFRMSRALFLRIEAAVVNHDYYFSQRRNVVGVLGLSSTQKITAGLRMFAYGASANSVDDYVRIGESTAIESLQRFVYVVNEVFGEQYRMSPNNDDIRWLLAIGEQRGFPGEHRLYALNMEELTPLLGKLLDAPFPTNFSVNGHDYTMGYYLTDGIYPPWSTLVKTIPCPRGNKQKLFAHKQEGARKDFEWAFGVFQSPFAIVRGPASFWERETLVSIVNACIVLHNMIIENENGLNDNAEYDSIDYDLVDRSCDHKPDFVEFLQVNDRIRTDKLILNSNQILLSTNCRNMEGSRNLRIVVWLF